MTRRGQYRCTVKEGKDGKPWLLFEPAGEQGGDCGEFVIGGGDGTKVLEFVEEALDEVALAIEREIARRGVLRLALADHG